MNQIDNLIEMSLEDADRDQYGVVPTHNKTLSNLFPEGKDIQDEVEKYILSGDSKYRLDTYTNGNFTYRAITKK